MESESTNPYAAPASLEELPEVKVGGLPPGPYGPYRDNRTLVKWVVGFLWLGIAHQGAWVVFNFVTTLPAEPGEEGIAAKVERALESYWLVGLLCMVLFGVWIVRSAKNAWLFGRMRARQGGLLASLATGSGGLTPSDTPGWAVGWYFIPIASFWKPYTAMKDIVRASSVNGSLPSFMLPCWWTLWILSIFSDGIVEAYLGTLDDGLQVVGVAVWTVASGLEIALHVVAILMVSSITKLQTDAAVTLSTEEVSAPDPPVAA